MRSQLTRRVFRQLLRNEPIVHHGCLRASATTHPGSRFRDGNHRNGQSHGAMHMQRRNIFNFSLFPRTPQTGGMTDLDPGIDKMMELAKRERMRARMPPLEDVAKTLREFFKYKSAKSQIVQDYQAQLAAQSLSYFVASCRERDDDDRVLEQLMSHDFVQQAYVALSRSIGPQTTSAHADLARLMLSNLPNASSESYLTRHLRLARVSIRILCRLNQQKEALEVLQVSERLVVEWRTANKITTTTRAKIQNVRDEAFEDGEESTDGNADISLWKAMFSGCSEGHDEDALLQALDNLVKRSIPRDTPFVVEGMLNFYMRRDNVDAIKDWFAKHCKDQISSISPIVLADLLHWCLKNNHTAFGQSVVRTILDGRPSKPEWDLVLLWAAGSGKGADEINRMLDVMSSSLVETKNSQQSAPDVDTINTLIKVATLKDDPYLAERFVSLGKDRNIRPNAATYVLQMEYRLKVKDVDGALSSYIASQSMDLSANDDVPTVNKLIVGLCQTGRHDFDTIMNVAGDLSDRRAPFEAATVRALCLLHLKRSETADVVDLLNTHASRFSSAGREDIRNALVEFCVNPKNSVAQAWDTYTILRNHFDEMAREQRTEVMLAFFERSRPDMAANIFTAMRAHSRSDTNPTTDTYVSAFLAIAKLGDDEILSVIHNQLKLDVNIDVDTHLTNALMMAEIACGNPRQAINLWAGLLASPEGPSYNSIHIALRACERTPFGDVSAQQIWARLRRMRVELDPSLWASYAAARAGNGDARAAMDALDDALRDGALARLDPFLVGSLYAGCPNAQKQAEVEAWCRERDIAVWEELVATGWEAEDEMGCRKFGIDRRVKP